MDWSLGPSWARRHCLLPSSTFFSEWDQTSYAKHRLRSMPTGDGPAKQESQTKFHQHRFVNARARPRQRALERVLPKAPTQTLPAITKTHLGPFYNVERRAHLV